LIANTNEFTFPAVAFISAAGVNLLIPSGGGQWAIQGEILLQTAKDLNLNLGEIVMAFAYGDQISNLLQPFWALPLLSITGVPIRKIFPYTFVYFLAGFGYLLLMTFILF
jgi:short-chain fatty acids transporter